MAFVALFGWIFLLLIPIVYIATALETVLTWVVAHLFFVNIIVGVLLALNLLVLAVLLALRSGWKRAGKLAWPYIDSFRGWKHLGLVLVKLLLTLGVVWEGLVVLCCVLYLVFQPLRFLAPV
ncbi:hypothetical protein AALA54_00130 [Oscillospiraceae bacterium 44-34]